MVTVKCYACDGIRHKPWLGFGVLQADIKGPSQSSGKRRDTKSTCRTGNKINTSDKSRYNQWSNGVLSVVEAVPAYIRVAQIVFIGRRFHEKGADYEERALRRRGST